MVQTLDSFAAFRLVGTTVDTADKFKYKNLNKNLRSRQFLTMDPVEEMR